MERVSVPFFSSHVSASLTKHSRISGLLRREDDALVVEFYEKTTDFNTMAEEKSPLHTVRIPLVEVDSLGVRWRFPWGYKVVITTHTLSALEGLPHNDGPSVTLNIARRDGLRARDLAATTTLQLLERSLRELGEGESL